MAFLRLLGLDKELKQIYRSGIPDAALEAAISENRQKVLEFVATNCSLNTPLVVGSNPDGSIKTWPNYDELKGHATISKYCRVNAIKHLWNKDILAQLAARETDSEIRRAAKKRLYDIEFVMEVFRGSDALRNRLNCG